MVYALVDPRNLMIRYVGFASKSAKWRFNCHMRSSTYGDSHKDRWIKLLTAVNLEPELWILDENGTLDDERIYIRLCRECGYDLTNKTDGGDGLVNPTQDVRDRIRDKCTGYKHTEEAKQKIHDALVKQHALGSRTECGMKGKKHSEATRAKMTASQFAKPSYGMKGKKWSESQRSNILKALIGRKFSEEIKATFSKIQLDRWSNPEYKEKMKIVRKQQAITHSRTYSDAMKKKWQDPDFKEKMSRIRKEQGERRRGNVSEETRMKMSIGIKASRAKKQKEVTNGN